jgi:hypothetical protein
MVCYLCFYIHAWFVNSYIFVYEFYLGYIIGPQYDMLKLKQHYAKKLLKKKKNQKNIMDF